MPKQGKILLKNDKIREVEMKLILQCAPLFIKRRISAFYMADRDELGTLAGILNGMGITARVLGRVEDKWGVLFYHKSMLLEYFEDKGVKDILKEAGYENTDLLPVISEFSLRYRQYSIFREGFPHEMGLILGYPVEDVRGYILNDGKNSLYIGCWKVYKRLPEKIRLFREFEREKQTMAKLNRMGLSLAEIVRIYQSADTL